MCQQHATNRSQRRGAAAVEFALLAPLFVMLCLGTWEIGRALSTKNSLSTAIREAGRRAANDFESPNSAETENERAIRAIKSYLSASGLPGDRVQVTIAHAESGQEGEVFDLQDPSNALELFEITATINYVDFTSIPFRHLEDTSLSASVVFMNGRTRTE